MTRFPDWSAAEVATAAKLDKVSIDYVLKTADESVTSSTTLQNDNHLSATIGATGTYEIKVNLQGTSAADAAGDLRVAFTFPTGTFYYFADGLDTGLASSSIGTINRVAGTVASGTAFALFGLSTSTTFIRVRGLLVATATGTLQFQWAQNASNANASTIKAGSHMIVRQVA